jgi:hypothetical protein
MTTITDSSAVSKDFQDADEFSLPNERPTSGYEGRAREQAT